MYNILCSKIENLSNYQVKLLPIINPNSKVIILPWSFATEVGNLDKFFAKNEKRYLKYINSLKSLGLKEKNIKVIDCYKETSNSIKKDINNSDILVLTGGNPEMLYFKVVQDVECLYDIKHYHGIIIGASAGAVIQFPRYFITAKNNYYKYFSFYDGFGNIENKFYIDVHSVKNGNYIKKLQQVSNDTRKEIYALTDKGILIYNREKEKIEYTDNTIYIKPTNEK